MENITMDEALEKIEYLEHELDKSYFVSNLYEKKLQEELGPAEFTAFVKECVKELIKYDPPGFDMHEIKEDE